MFALGGFSYAKTSIQSSIAARMMQEITTTAGTHNLIDINQKIVSSGNCNMKIGYFSANANVGLSSQVTQTALTKVVQDSTFDQKVQAAVEQTEQSLSLSSNAKISKTRIDTSTSISKSIRQHVEANIDSSTFVDQGIECYGGKMDIGYMRLNTVVNIIENLVQTSTNDNKQLNELSQEIAAKTKQTTKDAITGIILVACLAYVLFVGGPAIGVGLVVGKSANFAFDTLNRTPQTRMLMVAIIFMFFLWYISADCGGSFPLWNLEVPPNWIRTLPKKLSAGTIPNIPQLFSISIIPSFCTSGETDDDGNSKKVYEGRKKVAYGIVTAIFAGVMFVMMRDMLKNKSSNIEMTSTIPLREVPQV
jgi:hypothetical protein